MLSIYACTLLICGSSVVYGRAILILLAARRPPWMSAVTGFAALVVVAPLLLRLPGRATTAAIVLALLLIAAAVPVIRELRRDGSPGWPVGVGVAVIVVVAASIPFLVSDRVGVLGEGVYTNDHAAQLYWADWLQHGFGPEPSAVRFGYPVGPQAVAVIAAQVTGASLVSSFNGLLLAIPALTGLTALGALVAMPAGRRIAIASIVGLPYLTASFMAQSAFKETTMALFVLAFALALSGARAGGGRGARGLAVGDRGVSAAGGRRGVHVQRPRARLVRHRAARVARPRGDRRAQPGRLAGRARGDPRPPGRDRGGPGDPHRRRRAGVRAGARVRVEDRRRAELRWAGSARPCSAARPWESGRRATSASCAATCPAR